MGKEVEVKDVERSTMFQGVAKASAAFRLMQQMGWEEGNGLGKNKQGIKEHLRVRSKQDTAGIGVDQKMNAQANWVLNTTTYDNILKKLKVVAMQATKDDEGPDFESDVANEVKSKVDDDLKASKLTRPQGRFNRMAQGKRVGAYSKIDLAAVLGVSQTSMDESYKVLPENVSNIIVDELSHQISSDRGQDSGPVSPKTEPEFVELPEGWWGNKYGFVRAGNLGSTAGTQKSERTAFREQDQEDLYKLVTEKATKGKQGLGTGEQKKGRGTIWQGQRKALDLGNDEDDKVDEDTLMNDSKDSTPNLQCQNGKTGKRKRSEHAAEKGFESNGYNIQKVRSENGAKVSKKKSVNKDSVSTSMVSKSKNGVCGGNLQESLHWKKACKKLLSEAPLQTLSLKQLGKRVRLLAYGTERQMEDRMASLKQKLQKSSRFVVAGKKVTLSSRKPGNLEHDGQDSLAS